ncbi:hypothetical protein FOZ63_004221 [Perkinsus olseni]|uniref:Uncharacterized protein n=2 Tax=Perkinsus olseni TaxID=32597 RepID=A0A7J6UN37_PEROL|nr:hypothetical protein FOZ63_004221 [Perkinsus olseni]
MPSTRLSVLGARATTQHSSLLLQPSCQGRYARQPHAGQQSRYCVSTSTLKDDTPEDWASTLAAIVVSENALAELGPMKLSLTLQSCTRSQYFRSQNGWPIVDKAFSAVAACLVVPANLQKFNSQDLVLTLKAIERYMKERSHRQRRKEHTMSSESSPVLPQDHSIEACSNILSSLRGKLSYRTPLREFGMTLSSIVSIEPLRNNEITKDIIAHILACIKEGHRNRSLVSSSAKLGEEAFGQGLGNVAMALAKLRFEDAAFMNILADIVGDSVERLSLIDIGQISFAFGKLHIESSDAVFAMFGHIAERVADEEESLSKHLPTACSLVVFEVNTRSSLSPTRSWRTRSSLEFLLCNYCCAPKINLQIQIIEDRV